MGKSPMHAEAMALVRIIKTGYLSPQYHDHVVFDDSFDTIYADEDQQPPCWEDLCIFQRFQVEFDDNTPVPELDQEWLDPTDSPQQDQPHRRLQNRRRMYQDLQTKDVQDDIDFKPPPTPHTPHKGGTAHSSKGEGNVTTVCLRHLPHLNP